MHFGSCLRVDFTNGTGNSEEQSFESLHTTKHENHLKSLLLGLVGSNYPSCFLEAGVPTG